MLCIVQTMVSVSQDARLLLSVSVRPSVTHTGTVLRSDRPHHNHCVMWSETVGLFILSEHTCSSVVLIVKTIMSSYECVKFSSLLNTLKGICCDDEQYAYCTNSRGTKARSWF